MSIGHRFARWGGARLSRRLRRSVPLIGTLLAVATIGAAMRRKGVISGALDTGLNATPFVGVLKNVTEWVRGRGFFPDRHAAGRAATARR